MTSWNPRANDLFLKVLELRSPDERREFLDGACADDAVFRAEVEALLEASDKAGSFLQFAAPPIAATIDSPVASEGPGTIIGPYKLLQQIGEGGMGTVFMAEQTHPVQRKVALKVVKRGMDSSQVIARFEAERQALAMMDHVNIARVLDAGATQSGRPYFVMELVHGMPITKYCDENHLTPHERLQLFVPVCHAIQHAHQKGIIHRDIKPSNVMITLYDGKPVPKVIDFGVAKAIEQKLTERTLFTQYGTMVGTLEYMSPEQAEMSALGIDTRSDIYSLGVLLYELLTGGTPLTHKRLKEAAHAEILRMIKEEEPPKPSTRLSDSGEALASISANRHMDPAKLTKLVRGELDWIVMKCLEKDRNRRYETANGFAMDVQRYLADEPVQACPPSAGYRLRKFVRRNRGAVLAVGLVLFAVIAGVIGTSISTALLLREKTQTKAAFANAQANLDLALEALDQIYIDEAEGHPKIREGLPKDLLEKGLGFYEAFLKENARNQSLVFVMGKACQRAGLIFRELGLEERAVESLLRSVSTYELAIAIEPRNPFARVNRGNVLHSLGRSEEALTAFAQAIEIDPLCNGVHNNLGYVLHGLGRFEESLAACDRAIQIDPRYGVAHNNRGNALQGLKRFEEALAAYDRAILIDPRDAFAHSNRGNALNDLGRMSEALAAHDQAILIDPRSVLAHDNRGVTLRALGRFEEALAAYDHALQINPRDATVHNNRGTVLRDLGRVDEALVAHDRALAIDPRCPAAHNDRGIALSDLGRFEEALAANDLAMKTDPGEATVYSNRGSTLLGMGRLEEALVAFDQALEIDSKYAPAHNNRGAVLRELGRPDDALLEFDCAIGLDPKFAAAHTNRSTVLRDLGRVEEALEAGDHAIEIDSRFALAHMNRGNALRDLGRLEEALEAHDRATDLDPEDALAHTNRGNVLQNLGRLEEALAAHQRATEIAPEDAEIHSNRGNALRQLGRFKEALEAQEQAVKIDPRNAAFRYNRGNALIGLDDVEAAIGAYREAILLEPDFIEAHWNLGRALMDQGRFREAVPALHRGHELGAMRAGWTQPPASWIEDAERKAQLEDRMDQVLAGQATPRDAVERIAFAEMLYAKSRHAESARMYADAFIENAALANEHRYNAACSASLAAARAGMDAAQWRERALVWLREDFAAGEKAPSGLVAMLEHWKQDPDLVTVRDSLEELPKAEREELQSLWAAVDRALVAARPAAK